MEWYWRRQKEEWHVTYTKQSICGEGHAFDGQELD